MKHNRELSYGKLNGLSVTVKNNDFSTALRIFNKMVKNSGILKEVKEREYYTRPGIKRAEEKAKSLARLKKAEQIRNSF